MRFIDNPLVVNTILFVYYSNSIKYINFLVYNTRIDIAKKAVKYCVKFIRCQIQVPF